MLDEILMSKDQFKISKRNNNIAWKRLKACGAIPSDGKIYVLHHWDESLRHNNIDRYIQWNLYDIDVVEQGEHTKLHMKGKHFSEETRKKISESTRKGMTKEVRKKISDACKGKTAWNKGIKDLEETKRKRSESLKKYYSSPEHRRKLSDAHKGLKHNTHTKQKISNLLHGHTVSEFTREKIRQSALRRWAKTKGLNNGLPTT